MLYTKEHQLNSVGDRGKGIIFPPVADSRQLSDRRRHIKIFKGLPLKSPKGIALLCMKNELIAHGGCFIEKSFLFILKLFLFLLLCFSTRAKLTLYRLSSDEKKPRMAVQGFLLKLDILLMLPSNQQRSLTSYDQLYHSAFFSQCISSGKPENITKVNYFPYSFSFQESFSFNSRSIFLEKTCLFFDRYFLLSKKKPRSWPFSVFGFRCSFWLAPGKRWI